MAQYYQVVHGGTTVTLDDLRHMYRNIQCIDNGNGHIQYIINQEEPGTIQYQQNQQVIGIDQQTGAAVQLGAYPHQQLVDNNPHQQGVYVIEAIDHATQAAIEVQQHQQVLASQQAAPQQHQQEPEQQQQQQEVFYARQPTDNGLVLDTGVPLSTQPQQVAVAESPLLNRRSAPQLIQGGQSYRAVKYPNRQSVEQQEQQQPPQTHTLALDQRQLQNNTCSVDGQKLTVTEWRHLQEQQQQQLTVVGSPAATTKRVERSGVITVTRQNNRLPVRQNVRQPLRQPPRPNIRQPVQQNSNQNSDGTESLLASLMQPQGQEQQQQEQQQQHEPQQTSIVHRQVQMHQQEYAGPRRLYASSKGRVRSHNTLVTNNTVQAIASPTGEHHQTLLQQHDNVISVGDQMNTVLQPATVEESQPKLDDAQTSTTQVLLLLPNGEQRLIKFDIPHPDCSLRDLLGRVGVSMDSNVTIVNSANITDVATEQTIVSQHEDVILKQEAVDQQNQEGTILVSGHVLATQVGLNALHTSTSQEQIVVKTEDPQEQKPEVKEVPKYVDGMLAICHYCGYTSVDFNRCQRCKRKFPETVKSIPVKSIPVLDTAKKKPPARVTKEKFYPKLPVKIDSQEGKCAKRSRAAHKKNRKVVEEPVILTLSSDEDDNGRQSDLDSERSLGSQSLACDGTTYVATDPAVTSSAMGKEPIIPEEEDGVNSDAGENQHSLGVRGGGREMDLEAIIDGSMPGSYTLLQCRTVRIGSYKVVPRERVILSTIGIRIAVPSIEDGDKCITLTIDTNEILKVLIHFGRGMPVLFFYTVGTAAARIRNLLKMESKAGPYFDPKSTDETQRRITLLPERLNEDNKVALKNIFGNLNVLGELNNKEANDILVRASPKEVQNMMKKAVGMSPSKGNNEIQTIMVYPPPPAKGGIPINTEDYACLGEDQFLNDVIIDFYLKYLTLSVLSEHDQARTHVFSSFFYKRLTTRPVKSARRTHPVEDDPKLSPAEKRHSRVKSWTKNVNLFEKDFIIIPINEHCHWFLAIICFPGLTGCVRMSDNTPVSEPLKKPKKSNHEKGQENELLGKPMQIGSTTITPVKINSDTITLEPGEEGSDRDEAEGDDEDMDGTSEEEDNGYQQPSSPVKRELFSDTPPEAPQKCDSRNKMMKPTREPIRQPCILIFDSLAGASRTRVVATLRDYLRIEYKVKEGKERDFSKDTIKGASPKVPQQTNFTDCGLYLLQYVESFFQDPVKDYHLPMRLLANWFTEEVVNHKREDLQKLLLSLMEQNNIDVESLNLPKLTFSGSQQESSTNSSGCGNEEVSAQDQNTEGSLEFNSATADEEFEGTQEEEEECLPQSMNSSDVVGTNDDMISAQDANNDKEQSRSLVNYSDSESNSSMAVDNDIPVTFPADDKKCNTMSYLKAKRIDRHINKDLEKKPAKKMRADDSVSQSSFR